jgi:hypothetical protein
MPAETTGQLTKRVSLVSGGDNVVSTSPGRFCSLLWETNAGANTTIYDSATTGTGTIIGYFASGTTAGSYWSYSMPVAKGIVINSASTTAVCTVCYSIS